MALVRMRVALVGPDVAVTGGDLFPCDEATAARLVENGLAEWAEPPAPEAAVPDLSNVERAVKSKPKGRGV